MDATTTAVASAADLEKISRFNRTAVDFPHDVTIQELIETQIDRHPTDTAVICDHDPAFGIRTFTFAELNEKVNQLAYHLRSKGVAPGDIVAIMVERSFAMIIGVLGIIKAGAAYLPLPPNNPPERTHHILSESGTKILLVHGQTAGKFTFSGHSIHLDDPELYRGSTANPPIINKPQDLAYVIYTSGSTGKPKGVMIEHRAVINRLHWMQKAYPIDSRDVILQKTPYYFDVSVWELFWWALTGAKLCILMPGGEKFPLAIVETVKKHHVSVVHFVPSMLNVFLEYLDGKSTDVLSGLDSLRHVFASGEALIASHVRKFNVLLGRHGKTRLTNLYGPTEATVDVSYFDCPVNDEFEIIPIGRPIDNIRLYVLQDGRQVPIGETGELCIAGVGLARGYLNNAVLTDAKFTDNPVKPGEKIYRTGDLARWLPDGNVEYLGRLDHQVKIRGLRIELGEIESNVQGFPGIIDCVALVRKHSENVIHIVAYVVSKGVLDVDGLGNYLKNRLPDYMIPGHFEKIDAMPLTPSGKADRKALSELAIRMQSG